MTNRLPRKQKASKAVVLLSGGMDSSTLLYYAKAIHKEVYAVIINYNQRHKKEIDSAIAIANTIHVPYTLLNIQFPKYEGSALTDSLTPVPKQSENRQTITVVPLRNTFFLLHACAVATSIKAEDVYLGAVGDDQLSYPDCRPEFFQAFQNMLQAQNSNIIINYPFVSIFKDKVVSLGEELGVPWNLTWTCYVGKEKACGFCDACMERLQAFEKNNLQDPISYENK